MPRIDDVPGMWQILSKPFGHGWRRPRVIAARDYEYRTLDLLPVVGTHLPICLGKQLVGMQIAIAVSSEEFAQIVHDIPAGMSVSLRKPALQGYFDIDIRSLPSCDFQAILHLSQLILTATVNRVQ